MPHLFWDASGLAKYYTEEVGSDTAETLFQSFLPLQMVTTLWGYTETFALLRRKRNDNRVSESVFDSAVSRLRTDFFDLPQFLVLIVTDADIMSSITYIHRHNINATDAALLATLLRYAHISGETCVLVAADVRFCRAALAEGLAVINPQTMPAADVAEFLSSL